ncbi:MAG: hypothetical protein JNL70_21690 [Saprospiraceae bacterium]|nr:hypothetical protein [Saprospiraceae bacterium]
MIKILLDHGKFNETELNLRLASIFKKMNNNPIYAMFQSTVTALGVLSVDFDKALTDAEGRATKAIELKNKLKEEARKFLTKFAGKVEVVANDMPEEEGKAFVKDSGFTLREAPASKPALAFLAVPTNFNVIDDKQRKGWCSATWDKSEGATSYLIEELDDKGAIKNTFTANKTSLNIPGTESKVVKNFTVRATKGEIRSDSSDIVGVYVS